MLLYDQVKLFVVDNLSVYGVVDCIAQNLQGNILGQAFQIPQFSVCCHALRNPSDL